MSKFYENDVVIFNKQYYVIKSYDEFSQEYFIMNLNDSYIIDSLTFKNLVTKVNTANYYDVNKLINKRVRLVNPLGLNDSDVQKLKGILTIEDVVGFNDIIKLYFKEVAFGYYAHRFEVLNRWINTGGNL